MSEDLRCCGSGTCIIDTEGRCWCGQQWDGQKMCRAPLSQDGTSAAAAVADTTAPANGKRVVIRKDVSRATLSNPMPCRTRSTP